MGLFLICYLCLDCLELWRTWHGMCYDSMLAYVRGLQEKFFTSNCLPLNPIPSGAAWLLLRQW
jgi:hypothetical protein